MKNIIKAFVIASAAILFAGCIKETFPQGSTQTAAQVASSTDAMNWRPCDGVSTLFLIPNPYSLIPLLVPR